jgi:signal transduction histidine kinase
MTLKIEALDVGALLNELAADLQARIERAQKNIRVQVNVPPNLPVLHADYKLLQRLLHNLIDNAFQFTIEGSIEIGLEAADNKMLIFRIADSGLGIPAEAHERIWQPFERYEPNIKQMKISSTGLGLTLVKEIVRLHNGEVRMESEVSKGTIFYVALPLEHN